MSKLYDIVEKVVNSNSMMEAEQILYGKDGIVINSSEYYKNIISNFIQRKEIIIRKEKGDNGKTQLVFDLNNCNDMWNILFIYNYYVRYIDQKIELLEQEIKKCRNAQGALKGEINKLKPTDSLYQEKRNEYSELSSNLNKLRQLKQNYENYKTKSLQQNIVELENMPNIDDDSLQVEIEKLKEAINCIQKMRDSLAHANKNLNIDSMVSINNPKNKFEISIPIEYLDGFNKGRIIAKEEDKVLVQQTNNISSPILEALDFDIKKIDSFFYNVEPSYLEFLLQKVDYDVEKLYQLSINIFEYKYATKFFLQNNLDIFFISKLSKIAFIYPENTIDLLNNNIDISKLPNFYLKRTDDIEQCYKNAIKLLNFIKMSNKNIEIYKLPGEAFKYVDTTIMFLNENIDVSKLSEWSFCKPKATIELIKVFKFLNKNINISKLPKNAFFDYENTIKLLNKNIDISRLPNDAFHECDNLFKLLDANIDIYKLPGSAFRNYKNTIELLNMIKVSNKNIDISMLPHDAFIYFENTIKLLNKNIDISKLPNFAIKYYENTIKLLNDDIDIYKIPNWAFFEKIYDKNGDDVIKLLKFVESRNDYTNIYKIIESVGKIDDYFKIPRIPNSYYKNLFELLSQNIDISKLSHIAFEYLDGTIKLLNANIDILNLPKSAFSNPDSSIKLLQANIDISKLSYKAFKYSDEVIKLFNENIDIYKLPTSAFEHYENTIKLLNDDIDIYKLPASAFCNYNNIIRLLYLGIDVTKLKKDFFFDLGLGILNLKKILEMVDYDYNQLNTFPIEIFICEFCILDDMLLKYNSNISKSIFGINNPKIVATLIYANNVLSNYNQNISTIDMNIQPDLIIAKSCDDCFKYQKNIDDNIGKAFSSQDFIEQFKLTDENNVVRDEDDIRRTILTKIRNSCEHFRFKPVRDNNGNILEDKIYIYDEDNKGLNNFNLIIDLKDLVDIIREVEKGIELNNIYNSTKSR